MSGHSKWSNIKNKKGVLDAKRGKIFGDLAKNIRIAVKEGGGGDPASNPRLRLAVDKARAASMPNENIKRAIDRAMGIGKGGQLTEITYEGYGPGGVGFIVVVVTDNKMRTGSEIRSFFDKHGGSLGGPGSVAFMFEKVNSEYIVKIPLPLSDPSIQEQIESFVEILEEHDDVEEVYHNATF